MQPSKNDLQTISKTNQQIAWLEKRQFALSFNTFRAAFFSLLMLLKPDDHILLIDSHYDDINGELQLFLNNLKISYSILTHFEPLAIEQAIQPSTRLIFFKLSAEICNNTTDLLTVTQLAQQKHILTACHKSALGPVYHLPELNQTSLTIQATRPYIIPSAENNCGIITCDDLYLYNRLSLLQQLIGNQPTNQQTQAITQGLGTAKKQLGHLSKQMITLLTFFKEHSAIADLKHPWLLQTTASDEWQLKHLNQSVYPTIVIKLHNQSSCQSFIQQWQWLSQAYSLNTIVTYPWENHPYQLTCQQLTDSQLDPAELHLYCQADQTKILLSVFKQCLT